MQTFAVIGNPIAHSRSPEIHQQFAAQCGLDIQYERVLGDIEDFPGSVQGLLNQGIRGFNVTVPFKFDAWQLCDSVSDIAEQVQAVNTVTVRPDRLVGDNTDGVGLTKDLTHNLQWQIADKHVLLIGAGGAAKGVIPALLSAGASQIVICNRTHARAEKIVEDLGLDKLSAVQMGALNQSFDLVINCTSAGLSGDIPQVPAAVIGRSTCCYDMIYSADETHFNHWATAKGAKQCADGLGMLVEQAAAAFNIWTGQQPSTAPVIQAVRQAIQV